MLAGTDAAGELLIAFVPLSPGSALVAVSGSGWPVGTQIYLNGQPFPLDRAVPTASVQALSDQPLSLLAPPEHGQAMALSRAEGFTSTDWRLAQECAAEKRNKIGFAR